MNYNTNIQKKSKKEKHRGRLHPIHAKAMNGFYAPFIKTQKNEYN